MKKNELIRIADQDFVMSPTAYPLVRSYLKQLRGRYRFRRQARLALEEALRDVLVSYQTKKSAVITKPKARQAITMVGTGYETANPVAKLSRRAVPAASALGRWVQKVIRDPKVVRSLYVAVAVAALLIGALLLRTIWRIEPYPRVPEPTSGILPTTIGDVRSELWADYPEFPPYPQGTVQALAGLFTCVFVITACVLFLLRSRYRHLALALVLAGSLTWAAAAFVTQRDRRAHRQILNSYTYAGMDTVRTTEDVDYLQACGTEIRYVMGAQEGRLFYEFRDAGFELATELEKTSPRGEPTRATICTAYDALRRSHPDEDIVLLHFIRDTSGTVRPFDFKEKYVTEEGGFVTNYPMRYGFFVRQH